jgi:glycosyltransferase involved in cell wall biosynthesis
LKQKLLIFTDWYKPGFKAGGIIRSTSNLVDHLSNHFEIFIITRNTDYLEEVPYNSIKNNQWNTIDNSEVYYLSKDNIQRKNIKNLILEIKPDIIYCNSLYSVFFTLIPLHLSKKLKIKTVLAVCGMLSQGSLGIKKNKKKFFLQLSKKLSLYKNATFHASNEQEKSDIINAFGENYAIKIAQDFSEKKDIPFQYKERTSDQLNLVYIGRIAPEKNTLYALEVLNDVKSNVTFDIYGPIYSKEYWSKCEAIIQKLPSNITVNYKSILDHSKIDQTLTNYHVLFLPSTGENFGHVIIEGMINSCIPIISDKTPWRN